MNMHSSIIASNINAGSHNIGTEIAMAAARLVVEEGLDFGAATLRAVKQLGLPARIELPSHDEVETEVRDYIALFCADTQPAELRALRELALVWMQRMADFRPYLGGSVWHGTATKLSDIYIALFCDDSKSAEIALIDHRADYLARSIKGFDGATVEALSIHAPCKALNTEIGVHLMVYDYDDLRGALKLDSQGRKPRGDMAAVAKLLSPD
jgi:hypothetical protein